MSRLLVALLLLAAPWVRAQEQPSLPLLHVEGNRLADPSGQTVVLRGVSFSDPDKLEREGHWNAAYFREAASWGANVVRFPVHPRAWRARGEAEYLRLVDVGVALAAEHGLYVILDFFSRYVVGWLLAR